MQIVRDFFYFLVSCLILVQFLHGSNAQTSPSESRILLQMKQYLEYPDVLNQWNRWTNFCYLPSSPSVTVICSNGHITEITVIGNKTSSSQNPKKNPERFSFSQQTLSQKFSIGPLFTVLTKLSTLKKLSLVSLGIWGPLPDKISRFSSLEMLNISSNFIYGEIPQSITSLKTLKTLNLANNLINGTIPSLSGMNSLQELDLGNNQIGPKFPILGTNLVSIILQKNSLRSQIPTQFKKFNNLQQFDVSSNNLVGSIPSFVFSLPMLWYLNLADNQLTGSLPKNISCGYKLWYVDISSNLLMGDLPSCIGPNSSRYRQVLSVSNCLSKGKNQHPVAFCQRQALAVKPVGKPKNEPSLSGIRVGILFGVIGGVVLGVGVAMMLVVCVCRRRKSKDFDYVKHDKAVAGKLLIRAPPTVDSKYLPQSMRMPALGLPPYHVFTLEELEDATNNFDTLNLVAEEPQGQLYKGELQSGSSVLIKCIKVKEKHSSKTLKQHMEIISQLRHQNLVNVLGHCVVAHQDRSNKGSTIYIVLEHVRNGSLRDHLTDWRRKDVLKWPQRITISMGIARGVHFLHTGMAPGVFGNDLKIGNILLDESLMPKICSYKIPLPFKGDGQDRQNAANPEKDDIYKLGVILLEILTGKLLTSETELHSQKQELEMGLGESAAALVQAVDPTLRGTFAYQSLKTAAEITISCLSKDPRRRPSMEDVQWHLQYSIQAQQAWTTSGNLALNSGNLGLQK